MKVKQIYEIVNTITNEVTGKENIVNEDLSNIVDVGEELFSVDSIDNVTKKLIDHIGKMIFVNREYKGLLPSLVRDAWEFGSILEKVSGDLPEATENETWELENGVSYDPNIFYQPKVTIKLFNDRVTFEIPMSFTERQMKSAFSNATQLNSFISMLYNDVEKSLTVKMDALAMRAINNMIGETIYDEYQGNDLTEKSCVKAINVLKLYNDKFGTSLTKNDCITNKDFARFASFTMAKVLNRMGRMSTHFNVGGKERFTPEEMVHVVLLNDFAQAANTYLQSDTYHENFTKLPNHETIPYWQGSGETYSFEDVSKIDIKTATGNLVQTDGIIGVMFDRDACGIANLDRRTTSNYNARAEFFNNWFKFEAGYFNDLNENFVVFFVA